jgi:hypothetical protein
MKDRLILHERGRIHFGLNRERRGQVRGPQFVDDKTWVHSISTVSPAISGREGPALG